MARNDELEFNLEDILKEFGDSPAPEPEAAPAAPVWEAGDTMRLDPQQIDAILNAGTEPQRQEPEVTGDTIRLDQIQRAVAEAEQNRDLEGTTVFPAIHIEDEAPETIGEDWELEDEMPMSDYHIPEPIIFRPKSRLRELRQKLVSGPEQRYYALSELGLGKLQAAMIVNVLLLALAVCSLLFFKDRVRLVTFVQFLTMMVSALLGCYRMIDGVGDLAHLRFTPNTLLVITFGVCCVDGVLCLQSLQTPCCAVFVLQMIMALWAAYHRRSTEMGQMDTLRRATNLDAVACVEQDYENRQGYRVCRGEVEHFMDHYEETPGPERLLNWYCLAVLVVSLAVGVVGGILHGFAMGVRVCAAALLVGMPASGFLATTRPMAILEKRLHKLGTVLCGWKGIKALRRRSVYPLTDSDLFPSGAAKLNGVKFFGDRDPDQVVAYAAALIRANGGSLVDVFTQLRDSRGGYPYTVENLNHYAGGGIGGEIGDDAVLVGTLQFMQDMGVEMSKGTRVSQAVYAAIDGELCGVFAVAYGRAKSSAAGLRTLCGCRGVMPVVLAKDFMLTESFVRARFGVNTRSMAFPDRDTRQELSQREPEETDTVIAMTTKEGLAGKAYAISGARAVRGTMRAGVILHMVGGILGLLIMAAIAYLGATDLLTPLHILCFELVWLVPGFLITEWSRVI